jgi:hypothetical protein
MLNQAYPILDLLSSYNQLTIRLTFSFLPCHLSLVILFRENASLLHLRAPPNIHLTKSIKLMYFKYPNVFWAASFQCVLYLVFSLLYLSVMNKFIKIIQALGVIKLCCVQKLCGLVLCFISITFWFYFCSDCECLVSML